ncbi:hypothetical protein glysoja_048631, partial [Glycine soja]
LANSITSCGDTITNLTLVEKVLRTLNPRFDHIVVAIEESKDLESLSVDELQGSLEAHEQRLQERANDKATEQALQAHHQSRNGAVSDTEPVLLMVTTKTGADAEDQWYLDTGCSTHMTGHKDWFVSLDESVNHKVRFADDSTIKVEGHGKVKVVIKRRDGTVSYIEDVLYVPNMRCNLLSLGQLLEKKYRMVMEDKEMKIYD